MKRRYKEVTWKPYSLEDIQSDENLVYVSNMEVSLQDKHNGLQDRSSHVISTMLYGVKEPETGKICFIASFSHWKKHFYVTTITDLHMYGVASYTRKISREDEHQVLSDMEIVFFSFDDVDPKPLSCFAVKKTRRKKGHEKDNEDISCQLRSCTIDHPYEIKHFKDIGTISCIPETNTSPIVVDFFSLDGRLLYIYFVIDEDKFQRWKTFQQRTIDITLNGM